MALLNGSNRMAGNPSLLPARNYTATTLLPTPGASPRGSADESVHANQQPALEGVPRSRGSAALNGDSSGDKMQKLFQVTVNMSDTVELGRLRGLIEGTGMSLAEGKEWLVARGVRLYKDTNNNNRDKRGNRCVFGLKLM
jgi:hypothetical protein